ncbi:MAG TPA: Asd/ArgC dimerization domain-containing protein [Longimicrobiales bacterium]|nr:Asd/ArgC dimerization domain-containing protein [Longimicrobiales bacterium]
MHNYATAGVLGGTGYTGRELVRLLAAHPEVRLEWATSRSEAGGALTLPGRADAVPLLAPESVDLGSVDVVFSCLPHGESLPWVARARSAGARVVDLSADLRVPAEGLPEWAWGAVYGYPEGGREELREASLVANPGCYPTAVLTGLLPALRAGLVAGPVVVTAASGLTGAGRNPRRELLFAEVAEDFRAYGVGNTHRHLAEMHHHASRLANRSLATAGVADGAAGAGSAAVATSGPTGSTGTNGSTGANGTDGFTGSTGADGLEIIFTPHLLPVKRGILATMHIPVSEAVERPWRLWSEAYADEPFVVVLEDEVPSLFMAVGTNRVVVGAVPVRSRTPAIQVVVALDNLIKGAAGQAVQNMNLLLGHDEGLGLSC